MAKHNLQLVGEVQATAGTTTEPRYIFGWAAETRCVVTEFYAEWLPATLDEDIKAFLFVGNARLGLPPIPNYRLFYGPKASGTCPLGNLFDPKNLRVRFTHSAFDPLPDPIPLALPSDTFDIVLEGTQITVKGDFGIKFSIATRPFNS